MTTAGPSNRVRAWLIGLSVSNRMLAGFSLTAALFVAALLMALWSAQRSEAALHQLVFVDARISALWDDVESAIERTRRREKEFLLRYRELGFDEARNRYVTLATASLADAHAALAEIRVIAGRTATKGSYSKMVETTYEIETSLGVYEKEFLATVSAIGVLGSLDSGLVGRMRAAAHQMEAVIERQGGAGMMAPLLQVRRTEKDTELRSVERDGPALVAAIAAFRRQLATARMPVEARDQLLEMMGRYEAATLEYFDADAVAKRHVAAYQAAVTALEAPMVQAEREAVENQLTTNDSAANAATLGLLVIAVTGLGAALTSALIAWLTIRDVKRIHAELTVAKERAEAATRSKAEFAEMAQRSAEADAGNRAKSVFLATMSHEIRTPMSGMLGLLELLSLSRLDTEQRATLETIRESSRSLLRIVDDVLDFSKLEAGQLDIRPDVCSIRRIVQDVERIFAGTAASKGLALSSSIDPDISSGVLVDPLRLRQILSNFVSNSIKFTESGSIEIKVELIRRHLDVEHLRFLVRDSGIGISAENQGRLFQPFQQGDAVAARQAGGTGLGLTICRRLAMMMGGQVEMVSQPGEGTTIVLTLDLAVAQTSEEMQDQAASPPWQISPVTAASLAPPDPDQPAAQGPMVLLVDDHPTNRGLLLRQMHTLGYSAETAEDGLQAFEKWKTGRFAMVITDCEMPKMDGYELAHSIRTIEACSTTGIHTPVIACTAHALAGQLEKCRAAGMDECLFKPVDLAGLAKMLARWLPRGAISDGAQRHDESVQTPQQKDVPPDLRLITDAWGSDDGTLQETLQLFLQTSDEDAAMLSEGIGEKDAAKVGRAIHRMLGASKTIGAPALSAAIEKIARANLRDDWDEVAAAMVNFEERFAILRAYIAPSLA